MTDVVRLAHGLGPVEREQQSPHDVVDVDEGHRVPAGARYHPPAREEAIGYPSALIELDYSLNKDVTLGASIEFDRQWSNRATSNFTNVIFLVSATFGHRYDLLPKEQTVALRRMQ